MNFGIGSESTHGLFCGFSCTLHAKLKSRKLESGRRALVHINSLMQNS